MFESIKQSRRLVLITALLALPLGACNFKDEKGSQDGDTGEVIDPAKPITFVEIQTKILEPSCTGCHSSAAGNLGNVNLETYTAVKAEITAIGNTTVRSRRMPKGDSLNKNLIELLRVWIEQGAPE